MEKILNDFKRNIERELSLHFSNGAKFDGTLSLRDLREAIKQYYSVQSIKEVQGIYKIYIQDKLFYIGMSKSSIFSRIKRHYSKYEKSLSTKVPKRYSFFKELVNPDNKVTIEILRMQGEQLNYIFLIEELLTLSEKPKYKNDINNVVKRNNDNSLDS